MNRRSLRTPLAAGLLAAAWASGCGYTMSSVLPGHIRTIAVPVFANNTVEFGLADEVTQSLIEGFLGDRRLRIVREGDADSVLRGTIVSYRNQVYGYTATERATEYEVILVVRLVYRDRVKDRELWKEEGLTVRATYPVTPVGSEPARSETDGRREVIQKLTDQVLSRTLQGW